ncbi:o-succinylbenzoate--CoA ligase [Sporolactobacillus sp. Y61]|uniref:2-succinylbenzoate--CoA ligase n=1 Tax=Sporolactobacillus sp. Y61 TaxID=3160863 RepID=A0AAU8IBT3_9BACL|nr:o-succinylbenzoate--CoA ligase [Sporolactobacillus sp. THM19-2]RYL91504.1 o-succinylbenzoate--CoA ligase [Sporolactobacillus sp. THM19-2]
MNELKMPNWLIQRARLTPDRIAFETEDGDMTFKTLCSQVTGIARRLLALGIQKGDPIALLGENTLDLVRLYHALAMIGAVAVPLNIRLSVDELSWQAEDSEAKKVISDQACEAAGIAVARKNSIPFINKSDIMNAREAAGEVPGEMDMSAPCTIIYTSGTTGHPKGVVLTCGNHWWSAVGSALNLGLERSDKWLSCVPLFHVSGLSILMKNLIYGMTVVLRKKFDPQEANRQICFNGVTMMSVVSNMLRRMLDDLQDKNYPGPFRCMLLGGGPAPLPLLRRCETKHVPVYQTYGLTETASQMVTLSPEYMFSKIGSAGKPLFPGEVRIDRPAQSDSGSPGEILVRGPNVTKGYWRRPAATERAFTNGWLHTGDIGYLDSDGFLYVLDRRCDLIISGGENVYPAEIESVLMSHPAIKEAGVIGVKDEKWGEVPCAFVTIAKNEQHITEEEILRFCAGRLARYKIPVRVIRVDAMPRNASRKLLRRKLAQFLPENLHTKYDL